MIYEAESVRIMMLQNENAYTLEENSTSQKALADHVIFDKFLNELFDVVIVVGETFAFFRLKNYILDFFHFGRRTR